MKAKIQQGLIYNHTCPKLECRQYYVQTVAKEHLEKYSHMKLLSFTDYKGRVLPYTETGDSYLVEIPKKIVYNHQRIDANFESKNDIIFE